MEIKIILKGKKEHLCGMKQGGEPGRVGQLKIVGGPGGGWGRVVGITMDVNNVLLDRLPPCITKGNTSDWHAVICLHTNTFTSLSLGSPNTQT